MTAATNLSGAVVERYKYTPYGQVTVLDPNFANDSDGISDIGNTHFYTGRELDPETGLQLNRNRFYASWLGKWVTRDPIGYGGGMSLYDYVGNSPIVQTDPTGLKIFLNDRNRKFDELIIALAKICPCMSFKVGDERVGGQRPGGWPIEADPAKDLKNEAEFCACWKKHDAGCQLVSDLVNGTWNIEIQPFDGDNGWYHDGSGARRNMIQWNPNWNGPGGGWPVEIVLAHELGHAWHYWREHDRKGKRKLCPDPDHDIEPNVNPVNKAEMYAVRIENEVVREIAPGRRLRDRYPLRGTEYPIPNHDQPLLDGGDSKSTYATISK